MKTKDDLIKVANETLEIIREGGYQLPGTADWVDLLPRISFVVNNSGIMKSPIELPKDTNPLYETKVYVENIDTLEKAIQWGRDGIILNMASYWQPGGGFLKGSKAQEEEICRRSTLYPALSQFNGYYPLGKYELIHSPGVSIIRKKNYDLLATPGITNVISFAAIKNPTLLPSGDMIPADEKVMRNKIRYLLRAAAGSKAKKLVLGAWGCGSYHCPPHQVAQLFKEEIMREEIQGRFEEICFAILDNPFKQENNYEIFKSILCQ